MKLEEKIKTCGTAILGKRTTGVQVGDVIVCEELFPEYAEIVAAALRDAVGQLIFEAIDERINTPEVEDFLAAVANEAAHQGARWDTYDGTRTRANWAGLIGWLLGKALGDEHAPDDSRTPRERLLHRIIAIAAACFKWHREEASR